MPILDQRLHCRNALLTNNHGWKRLSRQESQ